MRYLSPSVRDARQLRHLIVKDGMVVEKIVKNGKITDAEVGLGGFLIDEKGRSTMGNKFWFLATGLLSEFGTTGTWFSRWGTM